MDQLTIGETKRMIQEKDINGFKRALRSTDIDSRTLACEGLGLIRTEEATDVLIEYLKDTDPVVRLSVASALFYGPKKAEKPLLKALKDSDDRVRINAAASLGSIVVLDASSFKPLVTALKDHCPDVRVNVVNAISRFTNPMVLECLRSAMKDPDSTVRWSALIGLHYLTTR